MPMHDARAGQSDKSYLLLFPRLEARRGTGRDIQAQAIGGVAIEMQGAVNFEEMVVAPDLNGTVARICHQQFHRRAARVGDNITRFEKEFARLHQLSYRIVYCN